MWIGDPGAVVHKSIRRQLVSLYRFPLRRYSKSVPPAFMKSSNCSSPISGKRGIQWRRGAKSKAWTNTYEAVRDGFLIHEKVDSVDAIFLNGGPSTREIEGEINGPYILLAPPSSNPHIVCLLGIAWMLGEEESQMGLYLNMFGVSSLKGPKTWHRGYRLELAHKGGAHNYTHVQPIKATGRVGKEQVTFTDPGVPDTFPAFPVRGGNMTTLCAGLAVALEGKVMLGQVVQWLKGNPYQKVVAKLLK